MLIAFQTDGAHEVFLNAAHVAMIAWAGEDRSSVTLVDGNRVAVRGTAEQVAQRLNAGAPS